MSVAVSFLSIPCSSGLPDIRLCVLPVNGAYGCYSGGRLSTRRAEMVRGSQIPTILNHPQQPFSGGRRALSASNLLTWGISLQHPLLPSCRTGFTRCFTLDKPLCSALRQCVCSPSRVLRFAACRPSELFDCGPSSCLTCQPVAPILRRERCLLSHFVERLCLCRRLLCQPRKNVAGSGKALDVCEHISSLSHNSFVSPLTNEFRS